MTKSEIFKLAHKYTSGSAMTKNGMSYKNAFALSLKRVYREIREREIFTLKIDFIPTPKKSEINKSGALYKMIQKLGHVA